MSRAKVSIDISVIIPVFNVGKYIEECIESVLDQSFKNLEIICVNDGSTDDSLKMISKIMEKDSRIVVINQENKGIGGARNTGVRNAKGKYLYFIDGDDKLINKNFLLFFLEKCEQYNLDFLEGPINNLEKISHNRTDFTNIKIDTGLNYLNTLTKLRLSTCARLWNKNFFVRNNLFELENVYFEDLLTGFKAYYYAERMAIIEYYFYYYRVRNDSVTNLSKKRGIKNNEKKISYIKVITALINFSKSNDSLLYAGYVKHLIMKIHAMHVIYPMIRDDKIDKNNFSENLRKVIKNSITKEVYLKLPLKEKIILNTNCNFWSLINIIYKIYRLPKKLSKKVGNIRLPA
jgi:glycosyltransferase involved in cell wall biosynthesis